MASEKNGGGLTFGLLKDAWSAGPRQMPISQLPFFSFSSGEKKWKGD